MQTSVTDLSDVEVQVDVEIAAERVDKEFNRQLSRLGKNARVKGFRKGKVPKSMLVKMYGSQLASDTTRQLIGATLEDALTGLERNPVGEPKVEPVLAQRGQSLKYSIRVQVQPEVKVDEWEGFRVEVVEKRVDPAAIDAEIEQVRERYKERVPVEDRGADTGDVVVMKTTGKVNGEDDPRLTTDGLETKIGEQRLVEGFEDQLMGAKVGDDVTVTVTFPEQYHAPDLAGQPAEFAVNVEGVFVEELPELDDDFAADAGYDNMEAMREGITASHDEREQERFDRDVERALVDELLEANAFTAPPAMVQAQLQASARRLLMLMQMQGMPQDQASQMLQGQMEQMRGQAERAVKRYLLLDAFAEQQEIKITDEELNAEVVKRIEKAGPRGEGLFSKDEEREELRHELRERACLDLVRSRAEIAETAPPAAESTDDDAEASSSDDNNGDD